MYSFICISLCLNCAKRSKKKKSNIKVIINNSEISSLKPNNLTHIFKITFVSFFSHNYDLICYVILNFSPMTTNLIKLKKLKHPPKRNFR